MDGLACGSGDGDGDGVLSTALENPEIRKLQ